MRTLAIGDIHGCFRALSTLVEAVRLSPDETLITLGDYVNRGPESKAVLDWLIHRSREGRLIPLLGNHEIMMLGARENKHLLVNWLNSGGTQTLASYSQSGEGGSLADIPKAHWDFLENQLLKFHETDRHLFVHARLAPDLPLGEQPDYSLFWEPLEEEAPPHHSGKTVICGHTSQKSGELWDLGHTICIDTAACKGGWLTCLDVDTGDFWQANEAGKTRTGVLSRA